MIGNKIRLLEASEIECRVGSIGKNGLSLHALYTLRKHHKICNTTSVKFWLYDEKEGHNVLKIS